MFREDINLNCITVIIDDPFNLINYSLNCSDFGRHWRCNCLFRCRSYREFSIYWSISCSSWTRSTNRL